VNVGVGLVAMIAICPYAGNSQLCRGDLHIGLPSVTLFDLIGRYAIRKRLHRQRRAAPVHAQRGGGSHEPAWPA
jgi:hypothetical protein